MTPATFAYLCGVTESYVSGLQLHRYLNARQSTIQKLASVLEVSIRQVDYSFALARGDAVREGSRPNAS